MLDGLAAIGGGAFVLASLWVGGRLFAAGVRRRELPELAIGAGLFLSAGLGYPLMMTAQMARELPDEARIGLLLAHMLCNWVGLGGLAVFTRRVFRPHASWATALMALLVLSEAGFALAQVFGPGAMQFLETARGPWEGNTFVGLAILLWSGGESIWHQRMLARRVSLGLADPVVAQRVGLWGYAMWTAAAISLFSLVLQSVGIEVSGTAIGALVVGPLGLVCASLVWLAFMPPRAYLERVRARAAAS